MALTLLDHLFDRETQARSNISGSGKHKKQQLDPLMIYGIRCELLLLNIGLILLSVVMLLCSKCKYYAQRQVCIYYAISLNEMTKSSAAVNCH